MPKSLGALGPSVYVSLRWGECSEFFLGRKSYPLTRGPILAPRPLTPEMDFSRSLAGHGSQYMWDFVPICPLGIYFLSSRTRAFNHQHWRVPASREETLAVREKFQKIGWCPPNHKPKTKKVVVWAKNVWDRYLILVDLQVVSGYV